MVSELDEAAQARWRVVNGAHLVPLVRAGACFERDFLVERAAALAAQDQLPGGAMSFDVICLIAEWDPAVAACRESRGTDFYWDAPDNPNGDDLPFAIERDYRGFDFIEAGFYYEILRRQLPSRLRDRADAFLGSVYQDLGQGCPEPPDDLGHDVGIVLAKHEMYYSMRPATVRAVLEHARAVPWPEIENAAASAAMPPRITRYDVRDIEHFRSIVCFHQEWLDEAARTGRGLIVLLSQ